MSSPGHEWVPHEREGWSVCSRCGMVRNYDRETTTCSGALPKIRQRASEGSPPMPEYSRRDVILANSKWVGGRNYYLAVWGEYEPTAGWTYERDMIDRIRLGDWLQPAVGSWAVRAVLRVDGWHRATRWSLSVATTTGVTPVLVDRGTCRSIREAQRVAGERLLSFDLPAFLRGVFKEDSAFWYHAYADGEHVASVNDLYLLPSGDYFVRRGAHTMKVQRWFGGYSTSRAEAA